MKDVFWQYFSVTGNVEAYVLYKEDELEETGEMNFQLENPQVDEAEESYM